MARQREGVKQMAIRQLLFLTVLSVSASASLLTTKRTQSSLDGLADEQFFDKFFGQHDPASTYGPGLQRNLAVTLPAKIGMHFPTAEGSIDHTADGVTLGQWQRNNIQALANMTTYSGLLDWASVFYVPDLGPHVRQFEADAVPMMKRSYTHHGTQMHVIIVYTPGSGHVLEIQSETCDECSSATFGASECAIAHQLPRSSSFYSQAWANATAAADGWSTVGQMRLPAPMIVQIKQTARDQESTFAQTVQFWKELTSVDVRTEGGCTIATAYTGVGPFADNSTGETSLVDYPLQYVFVNNRFQQASSDTCSNPILHDTSNAPLTAVSQVKGYLDFLDRLNSERVGLGWGWDRALDFHVKLIDSRKFNRETVPGASLDHWAALLTSHEIRFAPFNLTQTATCTGSDEDDNQPGPGTMFGDSSMIYTTGPANLGIEFWGKIGSTYFSADKPLFGWGGSHGSPTSDCRTYLSPADCSISLDHPSVMRTRVAANPPSNTAYAQLTCAGGSYINGISQATFGSDSGNCSTGFAQSSKCQVDIKGLVQTLCIGRKSCSVPASTSMFGTPCKSSTGWMTAIEATCASDLSESDVVSPIDI